MFEPDFTKSENSLLPVIVQDKNTNEVLMLAYLNRDAWQRSLTTGKATYWSRSRNQIWVKGETSGNTQEILEILVDCDLDTVIFKVSQKGGAACHQGYRSCFFRRVENGELHTVEKRVFNPDKVYKEYLNP